MIRVLFVALTENDTVRGVERYALELVRALAMQRPATVQVTLLCGDWQHYFHELEQLGVRIVTAPARNTKRSRHLFLMLSMRGLSRDYDLVHYGNLLPVLRRNAVPSTMTIHDVAEYALAGKYSSLQRTYRKLVGWLAARRVARIAADSGFTRAEIVRYLGVDPARITVVYPGVDHFGATTPIPGGPMPGRYFLYYGVIEETKGADTAIEAFRRIMDEAAAADISFVLIGRPGNAYARLQPHIDGRRIVHMGYTPDAMLQRWISGALAVVFVSRYEGFGLPAVESYMLNDRVIASRGHSVGEIGAGFTLSVDETDAGAVAAAMRKVIAGTAPRPTLSRDDVRRKFSWANAARQMAELFAQHARVRPGSVG